MGTHGDGMDDIRWRVHVVHKEGVLLTGRLYDRPIRPSSRLCMFSRKRAFVSSRSGPSYRVPCVGLPERKEYGANDAVNTARVCLLSQEKFGTSFPSSSYLIFDRGNLVILDCHPRPSHLKEHWHEHRR